MWVQVPHSTPERKLFDDDAILEQTGDSYDPYDDRDSEDGELPWEDPFDMDFDDIFSL